MPAVVCGKRMAVSLWVVLPRWTFIGQQYQYLKKRLAKYVFSTVNTEVDLYFGMSFMEGKVLVEGSANLGMNNTGLVLTEVAATKIC